MGNASGGVEVEVEVEVEVGRGLSVVSIVDSR